MLDYKLANLLLEKKQCSCNYPSLYCRTDAPFIQNADDDSWDLCGPGTFDFTTYFNAFSINKWRQYTVVENIRLHLELRGGSCKILTTWAPGITRDAAADVSRLPAIELDASEDWVTVELDIPAQDDAIIVGFLLECGGKVAIRNSYYFAQIDESDIRLVELALASTTFKKERYIIDNINLLKSGILDSDEPIAQHFHVHIIDNGNTLDADELSSEGVTIHPNSNVGGSGGFAFGMIAALEQQPPATHVLLMDDDVSVSPESIKRTYTLLTLLNDEYKDAFISGAMLDYERGEDFWEDLGFMTPGGRFAPVKPPMRMTLLADIVYNEIFVQEKRFSTQTYAAWWYCCIPTSTIKREGLPLPFFVRCDDAEYGIRCKPKFITMNGICIWHMSFHARYSAAVERYQTTRNTLIAQSVTNMAPKSDFIGELHNNVRLELKKFNYADAELVLDGFEDYLKGPDFISQPVAEDCFMRSRKKAEKLYPFEQLQAQLDDSNIDIDLKMVSVFDVDCELPRTRLEAFADFLTCNGQRGPRLGAEEPASVIPAAGWMYLPGKIRCRETLVAIDAFNRKGVIRRKDRARFKKVQKRYKKDLRYYKHNKEKLKAAYAAKREELTSLDFWKNYLRLNAEKHMDNDN